VRNALGRETTLCPAVGQTKGALIQLNLTASTDSAHRRGVSPTRGGASRTVPLIRLQDVADVVMGPDNYDQDVRYERKRAVFMGVWVLPNANTGGRQ